MRKAANRFARTAAIMALATAALPAQAQVVNASYRSTSKSDAILGGAPSALAAITASQGGASSFAPAMAPARYQPAVANYVRPAVANYVRPAVSTDRPDIFNSVALTIGRSPLDHRWNQVSGAGVAGNAG